MASIDMKAAMEQIRREREEERQRQVREFADRVLSDSGEWWPSYEMFVHLAEPIDMAGYRWTMVKVSVERAHGDAEPGEVFHFSGEGFARKLTKSGTLNQRDSGYWATLPYGSEELIARKLVPQFILDHLAEQANTKKGK